MNVKIITEIEDKYLPELKVLFDLNPISEGRSLDEIKQLLDNTDLVIGCIDSDAKKVIGIGRVLTDYVYKAWIYDVRVSEDFRSKGIGTLIIESILENSKLNHVKHFDLICDPETKPFYEAMGFRCLKGDREYLRFIRNFE